MRESSRESEERAGEREKGWEKERKDGIEKGRDKEWVGKRGRRGKKNS